MLLFVSNERGPALTRGLPSHPINNYDVSLSCFGAELNFRWVVGGGDGRFEAGEIC